MKLQSDMKLRVKLNSLGKKEKNRLTENCKKIKRLNKVFGRKKQQKNNQIHLQVSITLNIIFYVGTIMETKSVK